jgi:very-short-patch-repair endonuclease
VHLSDWDWASGSTREQRARYKRDQAAQMRRHPTDGERVLWAHLRSPEKVGGYQWRRQVVLFGWIVDFYCPWAALIVEVDGGVHLDQHEADVRRDQVLRSRGYVVLRFPDTVVRANPDAVVRRIREAIDSRPRPPLRWPPREDMP